MKGLSQFYEIYPDLPGATIPLGVCADGLLYANGLAGVDLLTGRPAEGLEAQTRLALAHLRAFVECAGGSIDNIGRAVAYVTCVEDRDPIYGPWDALFPDPEDRPAFKVLVGTLPPGHLVHFDVLAILGQRRTRTEIEGVPARDPTVRIGNWIFTSRVHGISPNRGIPEDAQAEAIQNFENLAALLEINGCTSADLAQMTVFGTDATHFDLAQRAYERVFSDAPSRPPLQKLVSFILPRFRFSVEMIAIKNATQPQAAFQEIYLCPDRRPIPDGARLGPLAIAPGLTAADPCSGVLAPGDTVARLRAAMSNMNAFLAVAGANSRQVARATFHMRQVDDRTLLNAVWLEHFPDESARPPHKYAPAALPEGFEVRLQVIAVPGAERRTLEIPGLKHVDPMAMGACTGTLVTSSRLFGTHAFTGENAKDAAEAAVLVFRHADTLLQQAGCDWSRISQVTAFIGDPAYRAMVVAELNKATRGSTNRAPRLNVVQTSWAGAGPPRIEIVALL